MLLEVERLANVMLYCEALKMLERGEKKDLHWQFAHESKEKLKCFVKCSKVFNDKEFLNLIWDVCDSFSVCLRCRKPLLRPVVALTLGNRFNEIVYLDLKEHGHNHCWILHLIDTSTRYSAARLIKSKRSKEIIHNIFLMWISYFGCPKRFLVTMGENLTMKDTDR